MCCRNPLRPMIGLLARSSTAFAHHLKMFYRHISAQPDVPKRLRDWDKALRDRIMADVTRANIPHFCRAFGATAHAF
jgi:hypothetical protein